MKKIKNLFSYKKELDESNALSPNTKAKFDYHKREAVVINHEHLKAEIKDVYGSPPRKSSTSDSKNSSSNTTTKLMHFYTSQDSSSSSSFSPGTNQSPTRESDPWGGVSPTGRR